MRRRIRAILAILRILTLCVLLAGTLVACGGESEIYADGVYKGVSDVYVSLDADDGKDIGDGYGVVTITIQDGVIVACDYVSYTADDQLKDENYGKIHGEISNQDYYNMAQRAALACGTYAEQLAKTGSLDKVDVISGATISYDQFKEAVQDALKQAAS